MCTYISAYFILPPVRIIFLGAPVIAYCSHSKTEEVTTPLKQISKP